MARPIASLIGKKYGMLTVIEFSHLQTHNQTTGAELKQGIPYWLCECDCGSQKVIRGQSLKTGNTIACGCQQSHKKHGMEGTKIYNVWASMKQRCQNPKHRAYKNYGARGISVCDSWQEFESFYADMGEAPEGLQLDRTDNDGNYEPDNCRWVTPAENIRNRIRKLN